MIVALPHDGHLVHTSQGTLQATRAARLPCGCTVFIGKLWREPDEPSIHARACEPAHLPLVDRFRDSWEGKKVSDPLWREVTVDTLLREAEQLHRAREIDERRVGA